MGYAARSLLGAVWLVLIACLPAVINEIVQLGSTGVMSNYIPIMKYFYKEIASKRKGLIGRRDAILLNFLKEHKEELDIDDPKDFLDVLLIRQPIDKLSDWEVTLIAWEFITAGTDTTSATMHWMTVIISHPPLWLPHRKHPPCLQSC